MDRADPPTPAAAHDVLTVTEVAAILRLDRKTVYGLIERGELPGVRRLGRVIRISRSALLQWLRDAEHPHNHTE